MNVKDSYIIELLNGEIIHTIILSRSHDSIEIAFPLNINITNYSSWLLISEYIITISTDHIVSITKANPILNAIYDIKLICSLI